MLQLGAVQEGLREHLVGLSAGVTEAKKAVCSIAEWAHTLIRHRDLCHTESEEEALLEEVAGRAQDMLMEREHHFCSPDPTPPVREAIRTALNETLEIQASLKADEEDNQDPHVISRYHYRNQGAVRRHLGSKKTRR
ncbi:MAG: hypothetical protein AAB728_01465 [Patescibacteria group bacterium]